MTILNIFQVKAVVALSTRRLSSLSHWLGCWLQSDSTNALPLSGIFHAATPTATQGYKVHVVWCRIRGYNIMRDSSSSDDPLLSSSCYQNELALYLWHGT
jgi:hypothetical protein